MPRPTRPGLLGALSTVGLAGAAAAAWLGYTGLQAKTSLDDARASLTAARDALLDRDIEGARVAIAAASSDTSRAHDATDGPVWRLATNLPGELDNSLVVVRGLAKAADDLADTVLPKALDGAEAINPATLRRSDGSFDLDVIRAAAPPITSAAQGATRANEEVKALPTAHVPTLVSDAYDEVAEQVGELASVLDGSADALKVAPAMLGADGPRRYLLLVQQPGESRGTGGLIGGFVEMVADGGRLRAVSQGSNAELKNFVMEPPEGLPEDFLDRYGRYGIFRIWQNINLSPDLPVVADLVDARWQAQGGQPLDGVLALDPKALATILEGSAPIQFPGGREVAPAELEDYLAVGQYEGVPLTREGAITRKDQLADGAALVAARLVSGQGDSEQLLSGLVEAVRSGHLHVTSTDPDVAGVLAEHGVDGGLPSGRAPVAYPVVYNDSEGKLDYYLDRAVRFEAEPCHGEFRRSKITVTLTNDAPATEQLPPYLTIFAGPDGREFTNKNRVALSVYGTRGAGLLHGRIDGVLTQPENPEGSVVTVDQEAGLPVWTVVLTLEAGQPRTVELELIEPTAPGEARVLEQPLARPLDVAVDVPACG